jgi:cytochrome P450
MHDANLACPGILNIANQYVHSRVLNEGPQSHVAIDEPLRPPPTVSLWTLLTRAPHFWERDGLSESFATIVAKHGDVVRLPAGLRKSVYLVANPWVIHDIYANDAMFSEERTMDAREHRVFTTVFGEKHITVLSDEDWTKEKRAFWKMFSKRAVQEHWDASLTRAIDRFLDQADRELATEGRLRPQAPLFLMTMQVLLEFIVPDFSVESDRLLETAYAFRTLLYNFFEKRIAGDAERAFALLDALMEEHFRRAPASKIAACEHAGGPDKMMHAIHMVLDALVSPPEMVCFMLHCLSHHPEVERRLLEEAEAVGPTIDFSRMPYFRAVLSETLRLFPLVYIVRRTTRAGAHIGPYAFEPNSRIVFDLLGANRHPRYWNEPNTFDPERFLDGREHPPIYSFGFGRLGCVGEYFTYHVLANVLIRVLRRYRIARPTTLDVTAGLVLMVRGDFEIALEPR